MMRCEPVRSMCELQVNGIYHRNDWITSCILYHMHSMHDEGGEMTLPLDKFLSWKSLL